VRVCACVSAQTRPLLVGPVWLDTVSGRPRLAPRPRVKVESSVNLQNSSVFTCSHWAAIFLACCKSSIVCFGLPSRVQSSGQAESLPSLASYLRTRKLPHRLSAGSTLRAGELSPIKRILQKKKYCPRVATLPQRDAPQTVHTRAAGGGCTRPVGLQDLILIDSLIRRQRVQQASQLAEEVQQLCNPLLSVRLALCDAAGRSFITFNRRFNFPSEPQ